MKTQRRQDSLAAKQARELRYAVRFLVLTLFWLQNSITIFELNEI